MDLIQHYQIMARYNRIANERLYEHCAQLDPTEYRKERAGSFGSIHRLLNHMLLADGIWSDRFYGGGKTTPPLDTVLHDDFADLRTARAQQDAKIEAFFAQLTPENLNKSLRYVNSLGTSSEAPLPLAVAHFFNHATHHRGQVHVMLSQTAVRPPALDLHRILRP